MYTSHVEHTDEKRAAIAAVFQMYDERLNKANALDFDDLLIKTVMLLRIAPRRARQSITNATNIFLSTNIRTRTAAVCLISYLTEKQQNICVVGDDAQSIYGFDRRILGTFSSSNSIFRMQK